MSKFLTGLLEYVVYCWLVIRGTDLAWLLYCEQMDKIREECGQ